MPRSLSSPERTGQDHHLDDLGTRRRTAASAGREEARAATQEQLKPLLRIQTLPASHHPPSTWATRHWSTASAKLATQASTRRCEIHASSRELHEAWRRVSSAIYFVFQTLSSSSCWAT